MKLLEFAREHSLSFNIEYSESEDTWYGTLHGAGIGEHFYVKKISTFDRLSEYLIKDAEEHYKSLKK